VTDAGVVTDSATFPDSADAGGARREHHLFSNDPGPIYNFNTSLFGDAVLGARPL
jgi:hypothetical protein